MAVFKLWVVVVLTFSFLSEAFGSKIFFHPFYCHSHVMEMIYMGAEVAMRGDEATIGLPVGFEKYAAMAKTKGVEVIYVAKLDSPFWKKKFPEVLDRSLDGKYSLIDLNLDLANGYCDDLDETTLTNNDIMAKLRSEKFDLLVSDVLTICRCNVLLPHMLKIPFVAVSTFAEETLAGMHLNPSVVPRQTGLVGFTPNMTLWQRIQNLAEYVQFNTVNLPEGRGLIEKHLPGTRKSYRQLLQEAEFWLVPGLSPYLNPPVSVPPNVALIGGLNVSPAKTLPEDLKVFCDKASAGLIVMSFGSLPVEGADIFNTFFKAFARLEQRVVARVPNVESVTAMNDNVKALSWIPQNDLLGHNNTVLFITHGGANGQHEALYHGVPMLGLPLVPSVQHFNVAQMAFKGFGLTLNLKQLTPEQIYDSITKILTDPSYKARIQKASNAFRADPYPPLQKAADWISFISKHGGHHFRPSGMDMPFWQYYMLDIAGLAVLVVHVLLVVVKLAVGLIIAHFGGKSGNFDHKKKN